MEIATCPPVEAPPCPLCLDGYVLPATIIEPSRLYRGVVWADVVADIAADAAVRA